jgi:hypothetical protein
MLPITSFEIQALIRRSLIGARGDDPVLAESPRARRRRERSEVVHFHAHTDERAEVCHDPDCRRPRLGFA